MFTYIHLHSSEFSLHDKDEMEGKSDGDMKEITGFKKKKPCLPSCAQTLPDATRPIVNIGSSRKKCRSY